MIRHFPPAGSSMLRWTGDALRVRLELPFPRKGRAVFRTNLGGADIRQKELIELTENGTPPLAHDWRDVPMAEISPGVFETEIRLLEVGVFLGKACFFAEGSEIPYWPEGGNLRIKVEPAVASAANTMYTAFVRQFGPSMKSESRMPEVCAAEERLDKCGHTVIPPSGTFRSLARQLDVIMGRMRFRILQLLPIHPVPTTYARMGRFGSPFAALDFLSVDPSLAEFDTSSTPLDQFRELLDAVHSRGGRLYLDLPANHTGWAATLQTHHPDWYKHEAGGAFHSPGAWGVVWADLVELDFRSPRLRSFMADVFLFWCGLGVDGFRCDAGYMIPAETWAYIVARVRREFPDTIFLLEGLGGPVQTTRALLEDVGLDWAYSELFQTENRGGMDWYLPQAVELAETCGPLIHFAETHDNNRLAARGETWAKMRVLLSAMLSHQGAFGMANGVEWFAKEKIDVHEAKSLNWGAEPNMVALIGRVNVLLASHPAFGSGTRLRMVQNTPGEYIAVLRENHSSDKLMILVNLSADTPVSATWALEDFPCPRGAWDLLGETPEKRLPPDISSKELAPGQVCCLTAQESDISILDEDYWLEPPSVEQRRAEVMLRRCGRNPDEPVKRDWSVALFNWPKDCRRQAMLPESSQLLVVSGHPFRLDIASETGHFREDAVRLQVEGMPGKTWAVLAKLAPYSNSLDGTRAEQREISIAAYTPSGVRRTKSALLVLPPLAKARVRTSFSGGDIRRDYAICSNAASAFGEKQDAFSPLVAVLSNSVGAASHIRAAWPEVRSQYDCLLSVNPDRLAPADRIVFWTRCRAWVQCDGFSNEVHFSCLHNFRADPSGDFAEWLFHVPCGMGRWVPLRFRLMLVPLRNAARLEIIRLNSREEGVLDEAHGITLVLRPDIEWRSFHNTTKAFAGPEKDFPQWVSPDSRGFRFQNMEMRLEGGTYHNAPEWTYMVPHPEEAERGLEASGDLFSPGWFSAELACRGVAVLCAGEPCGDIPVPSSCPDTLPLASAAERAMRLFVVKRGSGKTVIAGHPWFLDWGRDTLIFLRGAIAAGLVDETLEAVAEFARFERNGVLPNIIHGQTVGNYDTSDAPLWFCVVVEDLCKVCGAQKILQLDVGGRTIADVIRSIISNYTSGTPNGMKMDAVSGLIWSPAHFTWMDTNYPAGTPREGYPVEIQALWIAALRFAAEYLDHSYGAIASLAEDSLRKFYPLKEGGLADCLRAGKDTPASAAIQEDAIRPNQLYTVTLGILDDPSILHATAKLLVPGAIRSLADEPTNCDFPVMRDGHLLNSPHAPYWGQYRGDEDTRRKPAYHNGTAWAFPFPLYAEAMVAIYGGKARTVAQSLLASSVELFNRGAAGHLPEICDGDAPHFPRGCDAQAWSVSELLRVLKKI